MCQFISWVEKRDKIYFLTGEQLFRTEKGKAFIQTISRHDYCGHGTIRAWYGIDSGDGVDKECGNFSSPNNFPDGIVQAIKKGGMRGLGVNLTLLSEPAWAKYSKIEQTARAKYSKIEQTARAKYSKIEQTARAKYSEWDKYCEIEQSAHAKYSEIRQTAFWDLFAILENRNLSWM